MDASRQQQQLSRIAQLPGSWKAALASCYGEEEHGKEERRFHPSFCHLRLCPYQARPERP